LEETPDTLPTGTDGASGPFAGTKTAPVLGPLEGLGIVFQEPALWEHLSAEQHLRLVLAGKTASAGERRQRARAALGRLRLEHLRRRRPGQMSGGERQRLAIARAIVAGPRWLLLDEPLAHLDHSSREELLEILRELLAGTGAGVLISTHEPGEALRLSDHLVILIDGAVAQAGPAMEVYRRPVNLEAALALGVHPGNHIRQGGP
jgi:sulfate transport system ATP-binding protein